MNRERMAHAANDAVGVGEQRLLGDVHGPLRPAQYAEGAKVLEIPDIVSRLERFPARRSRNGERESHLWSTSQLKQRTMDLQKWF
jgi:hypothetical protein